MGPMEVDDYDGCKRMRKEMFWERGDVAVGTDRFSELQYRLASNERLLRIIPDL